MSKISLKPNASGTGVFSLEAPNSNVDRTLNLPDEAGTLATVENLPAGYTDSDALDLFNATGSAPVYACRAWVNFNGKNTVPIRDSGNVSSITDLGVGEYRVNFTVAMPDENYSASFMTTTRVGVVGVPDKTLSSADLDVGDSRDAGFIDTDYISFAVFR